MSRLMLNKTTGKIFYDRRYEKHTRQSTARRYARENGDKAVARKMRQLLRRASPPPAVRAVTARCEKTLTRKEVEFLRAHATEVEL